MGSLTELQAAKSMEQCISSQQDLDHALKPIDHHSLEAISIRYHWMPSLRSEWQRSLRLDDTFDALASWSIFSLSNLDLARGYWQVCLDECRVREQDGIHHHIGQQGQHQNGRPHVVRTRQLMRNIHGAHEQCAVKLQQQFDTQCHVDDAIATYNQSYSRSTSSIISRANQLSIESCSHSSRIASSTLQVPIRSERCLPFLGHVVSAGSIWPNPSKIEVIKSFPRLTDRAAEHEHEELCHRHARNATQPYSVWAPAKGKSHKSLLRCVAVTLSFPTHSTPPALLHLGYSGSRLAVLVTIPYPLTYIRKLHDE